jgi:sortase A
MSDTPLEDQEPKGPEPEEHKRVSHWDRPKPPHDWRWVVGGIGRALITLGLLMFGFVAYQLWGTGIQTAQAQRHLAKEFDKLVGGNGPTTTSSTSMPPVTIPATTGTDSTITPPTGPADTTTTTTTVPAQPMAKPIPAEGDGVARLEIPRMGLHRIIVEGSTAGDLAKGPGHFQETPLPGQLGNAAVAGHRTTHGHPFYDIDELRAGDEIIVTTLNGRYVYSVTDTEVVSPDDYADVIPTTDATKATLTLVSCTPRYSSTNRIVVHSELVADKSDALTEPAPVAVEPTNPEVTLPDEDTGTSSDTVATTAEAATTAGNSTTVPAPATTAPSDGIPTTTTAASPDAFADGWFSDATAIPQALLWGALLAAIAYGVVRLSRKVRHYSIGILAGFAPFIVALYFFYENVNRLLPPNL